MAKKEHPNDDYSQSNLLLGACGFAGGPAWGQEIGDRLRIKVKGTRSFVVGNLVAIDESKLVLKRSWLLGDDQITIPRTSIKQISRSLGSPKRSGAVGITIGLGIGVMGGGCRSKCGEVYWLRTRSWNRGRSLGSLKGRKVERTNRL